LEINVWRQRLETLDRGLRSMHSVNNTSRSAILIPSIESQYSYSSKKLYASYASGFANNIISNRPGNSRNEIILKINKLEKEEKRLQENLSYSPLYQNMLFLILFTISHFIWLLILGHILYALIKSLLVDDGKELKNLEALIGKQTVSLFGFGTLNEITLSFCFTSATIIGVYSISPFKRIRPRLGKMTVQQIIANVTVLLVISSSWPVIVRVLGLTRLSSAGPYENFSTMANIEYLVMAFRIFALVATVFSILEYYVLRMIRNTPIVNETSRQPYNHTEFHRSQWDRNTDSNGYFFHHSSPTPPDHRGMRR